MRRRYGPLVLCYHGVSETTDHELFVKPASLARQVQLLLRRGFRPATALEVLPGRGRLLHVTFDDAFRSVVLSLPDLERLGVPVTVFACSDLAERGFLDVPEVRAAAADHPQDFSVMSWDELRELAGRGVTVGSHTCSHPRLTCLSDDELDRELRVSKARIEEELGRPCPVLAYPYGDEDARVHAAARRAGYLGGFALPGRRRDCNAHALPRVGIYQKDSTARAMLKTSSPARR